MVNVFIYGMGRIGRAVTRLLHDEYSSTFNIVGFGDPVLTPSKCAYLLKYDTVYGQWKDVTVEGTDSDTNATLSIDGTSYPFATDTDVLTSDSKIYTILSDSTISTNGVAVLDCSGLFSVQNGEFLNLGANYVVKFYPSNSNVIVRGVNIESANNQDMISMGSCSTEIAVRILNIVANSLGSEILCGGITTIHAYTNDQAIADSYSEAPERGRAAAQNIVPTTTNAADLIGSVLTSLSTKIITNAYRVPLLCGSLLQFELCMPTTFDEGAIWNIFSDSSLSDITVIEDSIVSSDVINSSGSMLPVQNTIKTVSETFGSLIKFAVVYDNEKGFAKDCLECLSEIISNGFWNSILYS